MGQYCPSGLFLKQGAMLGAGLVFDIVISVLLYHTYESIAGNESYCTLWTDIPGRLSIFFVSYYLSGVCGCLPLPDRCRWRVVPEPFKVWKFWTWKDQIREMRLTDENSTHNWSGTYEPSHYDLPYQRLQPEWPPVPSLSGPVNFMQGNLYGDSRRNRRTSFFTSYGTTQESFEFPNFKDGTRLSDTQFVMDDVIPRNDSEVSRRILGDTSNHPRVPWGQLRLEKSRGAMPSDPYAINKKFGISGSWSSEREDIDAEEEKYRNIVRSAKKEVEDDRMSYLMELPSYGMSPPHRLRCNTEPSRGDLRQLRKERFKESDFQNLKESFPFTESTKESKAIRNIGSINSAEESSEASGPKKELTEDPAKTSVKTHQLKK